MIKIFLTRLFFFSTLFNGAISLGADYLVTLDKKPLDNVHVKKSIPAVKIVSPKVCLHLVRT